MKVARTKVWWWLQVRVCNMWLASESEMFKLSPRSIS